MGVQGSFPSAWLRRAGRLSTPQYGQTALVVVLIAAAHSLYIAGVAYAAEIYRNGVLHIYPFAVPESEPQRHAFVTFLSFLPFELLHEPALFWASIAGFGVCSVLWTLRRFCRWIGILTAFFYTVALSLFWEHAAAIAEWWNCLAIVLIVFAGWYFFYGREIGAASRTASFWRTRLFPQWVHDLCVLAVAGFFFVAGVAKLRIAGLEWADGTVLQLNIHKFRLERGEPAGFVHDLLLGDRRLATLASASVLAFENATILAVLSIPFPKLWPVRALVGFAAAGFLSGVFVLFGLWNFESMLVLVIVFLWPLDRWFERRVAITPSQGSREFPLE